MFCGRATFTNLSRYSDLNEKTYRRHYAQPLPFRAIHRQLIEQGSSSEHERIAAIDCTFLPKSGKKTEGLGLFYNSSHGKSDRGLEWSLLSVVDLKQNTAYTLNATQTIDTPTSADYLKVGKQVDIIFKETEVIIATGTALKISLQNRFKGPVKRIETGELLSKVVVSSAAGDITSIITTNAVQQLELETGVEVTALVKTNEVMLAPR